MCIVPFCVRPFVIGSCTYIYRDAAPSVFHMLLHVRRLLQKSATFFCIFVISTSKQKHLTAKHILNVGSGYECDFDPNIKDPILKWTKHCKWWNQWCDSTIPMADLTIVQCMKLRWFLVDFKTCLYNLPFKPAYSLFWCSSQPCVCMCSLLACGCDPMHVCVCVCACVCVCVCVCVSLCLIWTSVLFH